MIGDITFGGLSSGLDVTAIIEAIMNVERIPQDLLKERQSSQEAKLSAYRELGTLLASLHTAAKDLRSFSTLNAKTGTSSDESILTVAAGTGATAGTHSIEVSSLAVAGSVRSVGVADKATSVVADGTITITAGVLDPLQIDVSAVAGNNNLSAIQTAINAADAGVTASIINDGTSDILVVTSEDSGAANEIVITDTTDLGLDDPANRLATAADATLTVDGIAVTSASNSVSGVLEGITLDLVQAAVGTTVQVNVENDTEKVKVALESFVEKYNAANEFFESQSYSGGEDGSGGVLASDSTLRRIRSSLQSLITSSVDAVENGTLRNLAEVGIQIEGRTGTLSLDQSKLNDVLAERFDEVVALFESVVTLTDQRIAFSGKSGATVPGTYAVNITQAAEQASVVGSAAIRAAGIQKDENLTITLNGDAFVVNLLKNDTITDVVDKINLAAGAAGISVLAEDDGGVLRISSTDFGSAFDLEAVSDQNAPGNGRQTGIGMTPLLDLGQDVAGTLGGFAATGVGKVLTGDIGSDVDGLSIAANLSAADITATGGDFGTVTFGDGLADKLSDALDFVTDPLDGTLKVNEDGIQAIIDRLEDDIEAFDRRLDRREALLVQKFSAAERAIALLQSQLSSLGVPQT